MLRPLGYTLFASLLLLGTMRCDLTHPVERQSLVVEAFLETGHPLPPVTLRQTRPLAEPIDSIADAAAGGQVEIVLDGRPIAYEEAENRPGRYVPVEDPVVPAGVDWQLTARWEGETGRTHGTAPPPIRLSEVCIEVPEAPIQAILVDSLRRDSLDIPAEQGYLYPVDVSLRWSTEPLSAGADTTYWMRARLRPDTLESTSRVVDFFLQPAEVRREDGFPRRDGARQWQGVYAVPVNDSAAALPHHALTVSLVRGDTAFAAFARSRTDPERREPISNVEGAIGIATAVASDSMRRNVRPGIDRCRSH